MMGTTTEVVVNKTIDGVAFVTNSAAVVKGAHPISVLAKATSQVGDLTWIFEISSDDVTFYPVTDPADNTVVISRDMLAAATGGLSSWVISEMVSGMYCRLSFTGGTSGTIDSIKIIS